jgi:WD40 repeat protein
MKEFPMTCFQRVATGVSLFLAFSSFGWPQQALGQQNKKEPEKRLDLFGDPLPKGAVSRLGTTRWRGLGEMLAFSRDGKFLASTLGLWDAKTGKKLRQWNEFNEPAGFLFFPRDGKTVIVAKGGVGGQIDVWDIATSKNLRRLPWTKELGVPTWTDDGKVMLGDNIKPGKNMTLTFIDMESGKQIRQWQTDAPRSDFARWLHLFGDGKTLAIVQSREIRLFDALTGNLLHRMEPQNVKPLGRSPVPAHFHEEGNLLVWTFPDHIQLWNTKTGQFISRFSPDKRMGISALAPDGKILAVAPVDRRAIVLCDLPSGKPLRVLQNSDSTSSLVALTFSGDGKVLASLEYFVPAVRLWDVATGKELTPTEPPFSAFQGLAFAPDGKTLVSVGQADPPRLWDPATGKLLRRFQKGPQDQTNISGPVAVSPDAKTLVLGGGEHLAVWDFPSGKHLYEHQLENRHCFYPTFWTSAETILTSYTIPYPGEEEKRRRPPKIRETIIGQWDVRARKETRLFNVKTNVPPNLVAFSRDGTKLAGISHGLIHVWDMNQGQELQQISITPHNQGKDRNFTWTPEALTFLDNGQSLVAVKRSAANQYTFFTWDVATGKARNQWELKTDFSSIRLFYFVKDRFAALVDLDMFKLVDLETGRVLASFEDHGKDDISCCAFSPDGNYLAIGNNNASGIVWALGGLFVEEEKDNSYFLLFLIALATVIIGAIFFWVLLKLKRKLN